jgi:hypothetical protein
MEEGRRNERGEEDRSKKEEVEKEIGRQQS